MIKLTELYILQGEAVLRMYEASQKVLEGGVVYLIVC